MPSRSLGVNTCVRFLLQSHPAKRSANTKEGHYTSRPLAADQKAQRLPRPRTTSLGLKVLRANQQVAGNSKQQLQLKQQVPQKQH
ncbi:hypothetical protein RB213_004918 [Colletotrichum asianum]